MDQNELEMYQVQLSQVEQALKTDPDNEELASLASELKELIELTKQSIASTAGPSAPSSSGTAASKPDASRKPSQTSVPMSGKAWSAGDECLAKYAGDGNWYPAKITSVGGAADNKVYSIVFKGYNTTELVKASELKGLTSAYLNNSESTNPYSNGAAGKRKLSKVEEEEKLRKKARNEKKLEVRAVKAREQNEKKATWQKFTKKAEKKGISIAGVSGTSIFKTPDNPLGKGLSSSHVSPHRDQTLKYLSPKWA